MARTSTGRRAQGPERTPLPKRVPARAPRTEPDLLPSQEAEPVLPFPKRLSTPPVDADAEVVQQRTRPTAYTPAEEASELPEPEAPIEPAPAPSARLLLEPLSVQDVDRLWDWYRADANARALFEQHFASSPELHQAIAYLVAREQSGQVWLRAIRYLSDDGRAHLGFVLLGPFLQGTLAAFRLYLEPNARPAFEALFPFVLDEIDRALPAVTLSLVAPDAQMSEAMQRHGFEAQVILTRTPRPPATE